MQGLVALAQACSPRRAQQDNRPGEDIEERGKARTREAG